MNPQSDSILTEHDPKAFIHQCPVDGEEALAPTTLRLAEGMLRRCPKCGQLVSSCDEGVYARSMTEFDDPRGTLPAPGSEARRFKRERRIIERMAHLLGRPVAGMRLLDVGCSTGALLASAERIGARASGVEPAPRAAQAARAAGFDVRQGFLHEAGYEDAAFDAVTLLEVIEHLRDPASLLREIHRVLRPGGILAIGTGNAASWTVAAMGARWRYFSLQEHGGHVSFFNPHSLALLAARCEFEALEITTRSVRLVERGDCPRAIYVAAKLVGEALAFPARWASRGHDMLGFFRARGA